MQIPSGTSQVRGFGACSVPSPPCSLSGPGTWKYTLATSAETETVCQILHAWKHSLQKRAMFGFECKFLLGCAAGRNPLLSLGVVRCPGEGGAAPAELRTNLSLTLICPKISFCFGGTWHCVAWNSCSMLLVWCPLITAAWLLGGRFSNVRGILPALTWPCDWESAQGLWCGTCEWRCDHSVPQGKGTLLWAFHRPTWGQ